MARAAPGFRHGYMLGLLNADVERMSPQALKRVLERRLEAVESHIRALSDQLDAAERRTGPISDWKWSKAPVTERRWDLLADLSYHIAARDALQDAISTL